MRVIDVHTHAFPDALAPRAVARLEVGNARALTDGTIRGLLSSMDRAGVERSVICSIATKPEQFVPILEWSRSVASEPLLPLASIHPLDPLAPQRVGEVQAAGIKGLKIHPYYQGFDLADPALAPFFSAVEEAGLILVSHTGFDMAFPQDRRADSDHILALVARHPRLLFMATHMGAWCDWGEVAEKLIGKPIHMDISLSVEFMPPELARRCLLGHPAEYLYFGSDSPWGDPGTLLGLLQDLRIPDGRLERLLSLNACALFGL